MTSRDRMKRFWRRLRPDHLAGEIALLVLISIILFHVAVTIALNLFDADRGGPTRGRYEMTAGLVTAIDLAAPAERAALLDGLARAAPGVALSLRETRPPAARGRRDAGLESLRAYLWPGAELFAAASPERAVTVALRKGGYLTLALSSRDPVWRLFAGPGPRAPGPGGPPPPPGAGFGDGPPPDGPPRRMDQPVLPSLGIWIASGLFFLICAATLTVWTSNAVVAPLVELSRRAEKFPSDSERREVIAEKGPQEVRDLTRALNRMQDRIHSMMAARSRALAAISHDLRTIITRMRLRAEFIDDDSLRAKMLHDAELMDSMLAKNLLYLRGERSRAAVGVVDLDSVLQTIVDQFADVGHEVSYESGGRQMVIGSLTDLQRIFANLIENAAAHATHIVISVERLSPNAVRIDVADDGPGIPAEDKARVLEPFVRGRPERNMNEHGGFGLGLSIVGALLEEAGGGLELVDREPHGLIARVTLRAAEGVAA
jgi:signal transduction histidine kinase